jgi:hypothetical protein
VFAFLAQFLQRTRLEIRHTKLHSANGLEKALHGSRSYAVSFVLRKSVPNLQQFFLANMFRVSRFKLGNGPLNKFPPALVVLGPGGEQRLISVIPDANHGKIARQCCSSDVIKLQIIVGYVAFGSTLEIPHPGISRTIWG